MSTPNRLARTLSSLQRVPAPLRPFVLSRAFGARVRFAGTASLRIATLREGHAELTLANHRKVQNHIGGIHAAAMALLAETATGAVLGMTIPDTHLPLLKSMHVDYRRLARGGLRAVATLDEAQRARILTEEKGDLTVPCVVTDDSGEQPIDCAMTWAWVPKRRG